MALDRQINIFSVDTGDFYSNTEQRIHWKNSTLRRERNFVLNKIKEIEKELLSLGYTKDDLNIIAKNKYSEIKIIHNSSELIDKYTKFIWLKKHKGDLAKKTKDKLLNLLENKVKQNEISDGKDHIRKLNQSSLTDNKIISLFESSLTRTMNIKKDELTKDLIVLQVYYFDIFKDICYYGFELDGERYRYLTSSAGQIRKKKAVFIKQSSWDKYKNTIMCGLTIDRINQSGGNNVNKHLAYMALTNSATDEWENFNIDKCIVVDDFETNVFGTYDLIDDKTYTITRTSGEIPISHTDGAGMMLPSLLSKNTMVRLPWIKGLLGVFDFRKFVMIMREKYNNTSIGVIKDIYDKEHDIISEDIQIIFTKSQFKMYKYYTSWDEYKDCFNKYNCSAGICNMEEDKIKNSRLNYQELQTLTDMTTNELELIAAKSINKLVNLCSSSNTMQEAFGVTPYNMKMTPLQQAIKLYPNLLNDEYLKITLRNIKDSLIQKYRSGKLEIEGKYTFLLPDFYAFCENLFLHIDKPNGLLSNKEVFCWLFKKRDKLDCLRSPHLYKEHAIRFNTANQCYGSRVDEIRSWFTTNAIYTSSFDLISKILQFDVDGDRSLVIGDPDFVRIAERNMVGVVPLYYNMRKASPVELNPKNIYAGLSAAFTESNIGIYSNDISKIYNDDIFVTGDVNMKNVAMDVVKLLCMENNFVIDYAKTLYKPKRPKAMSELITSFTKKNLPHFFLYAKDKCSEQVEANNGSLVNQLEHIIPNVRINTRKAGLGKIDYRLLMDNPDIQINKRVIEKYEEINSAWHFKINMKDAEVNNLTYLERQLRNELLNFGYSEGEVSDMLIKHLYGNNNKPCKDTLWFCYGKYIVKNIQKNIDVKKTKVVQCVDCGEWMEIDIKDNRTNRCTECMLAHKRELDRANKHKNK